MATVRDLETVALSTPGVTHVVVTVDDAGHAVELEIEAESLAVARRSAMYVEDYVPAGIVMTWIPAGPAASEALALLDGEIDWRPSETIPEDFYAL